MPVCVPVLNSLNSSIREDTQFAGNTCTRVLVAGWSCCYAYRPCASPMTFRFNTAVLEIWNISTGQRCCLLSVVYSYGVKIIAGAHPRSYGVSPADGNKRYSEYEYQYYRRTVLDCSSQYESVVSHQQS